MSHPFPASGTVVPGAFAVVAATMLLPLSGAGPAPTPPRTLHLVFTGRIEGRMEPCGCSGNPVGGLPRLMTAVSRIRAANSRTLVLDAGRLVPDGSAFSSVKLETLVLGFQAAGYNALVAAVPGWAGAGDAIRPVGEGAGLHVLDPASAVGRAWAGSVGPPAGGVRVGLAALPTTREAGGRGLARAMADAARGCAAQVRVLVTDAPVDAAANAARSGGFQVVIATGEDDETPRYVPLGATGVVVSPGLFGRYVVDVAVSLDGGAVARVAPSFVRLDSAVPPSATGKRILEAYQQRLKDERLVERTPRLPLPARQRYVGAEACRACHQTQATAWDASRHSDAFHSLQQDGRWADPDCVPCHVTGFPCETGYAPEKRTPALAAVGCECCHGPGSLHAADPKTRTPRKAREACPTCHTPERSPKFDRDAYLARIKHWRR